MTGFIACLLPLELEPDAARKLAMRSFGLGQILGLLEPIAHIEQVFGQIGPADVDAEAVDDATAFSNGAAGLPERAALAGTGLVDALSG